MSQYIHFFIRANDQMLPLYTIGRSSLIYQNFCSYAPYGKISPLSKNILNTITFSLKEDIIKQKETLADCQDDLNLISSFNDNIDDKLSAIETVRSYIKEQNENLQELNQTLIFTNFLIDILSEAEEYSSMEENNLDIDVAQYLYVGIECGFPQIKDIQGSNALI